MYNDCEKKEKSNEKIENEQGTVDLIKEFGILGTNTGFKSELQYINIIGSIEGHMILPADNKTTKYEHLIPQLVAAEENPDIKGVLVILNTVGGDVEAGLAIAELMASLSKPVVSLVLGGGHSIGIPLAVASNYSFIVERATMTLHPIRTTGLVITSEPNFEYLKKTQDRIVDFIVENSHARRDKILELMNCTDNMANDVGTILFGREAVKIGLIDDVGGLDKALTRLRFLIDQRREKGELAPKKNN